MNELIIKTTNVIWDGFGTSLCWFGNSIGKNASESMKEYLSDVLFNENNEDGLQLSVVRYNIGGGAYVDEALTMRKGSDIEGWVDNTNSWDSVDLGQRYFLKKAMVYNVKNFEVFSNSPPPSMTYSGKVQGSYSWEWLNNLFKNKFSKFSFSNNLKWTKAKEFSEYLINVTNYLIKHDNIPITSISPINEPSGPGWVVDNGQEGCHYNFFGIRTKLFYNMKKYRDNNENKVNNQNIMISGTEENNMLQGLFALLLDPFSLFYIDKYNVHRYTIGDAIKIDTSGMEDSNILKKIIHFIVNTCFNKKIWMSEWGMGYTNNVNDYKDIKNVFIFANSLMDDIIYLQPSAWVYWQVVENASGNGWGSMQIPFDNFKDKNDIIYGAQYYAFQHFTHYIKTGDTILNIKSNKKELKIIGSKRENGIYNLIILNESNEDKSINLSNIQNTENKVLKMMETTQENNNIKISNEINVNKNMITIKKNSLLSIQLQF